MDLHEVANTLAQRVSGKSPLGGTVKFDLGDAGAIFIDGDGGGNSVTAHSDEPARCTITMSANDLRDLIDGRLHPTSAFMQGRMRVDGDMFLAMKLGQMV